LLTVGGIAVRSVTGRPDPSMSARLLLPRGGGPFLRE
jgi:hypothetical protein